MAPVQLENLARNVFLTDGADKTYRLGVFL